MAKSKGLGGRKTRRRLRRLALLAAAALLLGVGIYRVSPLLAQEGETVYIPYEVSQGTVRTSISLSGTISVAASETISNESTVSFTDRVTVREIFVTDSQRVQKDDKLLQLSNGDVYTAGIDGMVNEIRVSQGDWVRPGATLMEISDIDHLIVTISVDEFDIDCLQVGQSCTITVLPLEISFDTQIGHINRVSDAMGWVASYTVTADANAPESVLPGMQATVTIPQQEAVDVPVLPMEAISFDTDGEPYVWIQQSDGTYARQAITAGLSDGMNVQITSGLSVGDTLWVKEEVVQTESTLSLGGIYKKLFGEKVEIIARTDPQAYGTGGGAPEPIPMPEDAAGQNGMNAAEKMVTAGEAEMLPAGMPPTGMTPPEKTETTETERNGPSDVPDEKAGQGGMENVSSEPSDTAVGS